MNDVKDISWMTYLMLILASYRFTHLIVFDKITEFIRKPFLRRQVLIDQEGNSTVKKKTTSMFGYLLNCYWCAGVWSAIFIGLGYWFIPDIAMPIIFIFSIAGAAAILETMIGMGTKLIAYLSKKVQE